MLERGRIAKHLGLTSAIRRQVIADYVAALPRKVIARKHDIEPWVVTQIAKAAGVIKRNRRYERLVGVIREAYVHGDDIAEIAERTGLLPNTVYRYLRQAGISAARTPRKAKLRTFAAADIVHEYLAGDSPRAIAERHGVHPSTVLVYVRKAGHAPRPRGCRQMRLAVDPQAVARDYTRGLSLVAVAARHGVSDGAVRYHLRKLGVPRRPPCLHASLPPGNCSPIRGLNS